MVQEVTIDIIQLPTVEIKDYNVKIIRRNFYDQPAKNDITTYDHIQKSAKESISGLKNIRASFLDAVLNLLSKSRVSSGSGITLTKNEKNYIIKVIRSLENKRIVLKRTTNKIINQKGKFSCFLRLLMTTGLPIMENVLTPLAKIALVPLGLTGSALATGAIQDAISYSRKIGSKTTQPFSNEEIDDIMKIVKSLEDAGSLIKVVSKKNEVNPKKDSVELFQSPH